MNVNRIGIQPYLQHQRGTVQRPTFFPIYLLETVQLQGLHRRVKEKTEMIFSQLVLHAGRQQIRLIRLVRQKSSHTSLSASSFAKLQAGSHAVSKAPEGPGSSFQHRTEKTNDKQPSSMSSESSPQVFTDVSVDPFVRGLLHRPANPNGNGLLLTHGAGSNCQAPLLIALAKAFSGAGFIVLRCDLPFRQDRPYGPPGPGDAKRDRAGLRNALAALKSMASGRVFLSGHSYGGRQASMLCAELLPEKASEEAADLVTGLLLLSYPLHPPRKPDQLRIQHLFNLRTPTLFVQGTRDPFGSIAEIEQALKLIPAKTKLLPVEGAGHDLGFKGKSKQQELPETVFLEFKNFLNQP
jgi:predicted alpha/beta-hydrolase family hydrolase